LTGYGPRIAHIVPAKSLQCWVDVLYLSKHICDFGNTDHEDFEFLYISEAFPEDAETLLARICLFDSDAFAGLASSTECGGYHYVAC